MPCTGPYPLILSDTGSEYRLVELPQGMQLCDEVGATGATGSQGSTGATGATGSSASCAGLTDTIVFYDALGGTQTVEILDGCIQTWTQT